jgi:hypothetical protein
MLELAVERILSRQQPNLPVLGEHRRIGSTAVR